MISAIKEISNKADNGYKMRLSRTLEGRRFGETDGHSDGRTNGWTNPPIEMRRRIRKQVHAEIRFKREYLKFDYESQ